MTAHRILNVLLAVFVVSAWLYLAANFDREAIEGDTRHQAAAFALLQRHARGICGRHHQRARVAVFYRSGQ